MSEPVVPAVGWASHLPAAGATGDVFERQSPRNRRVLPSLWILRGGPPRLRRSGKHRTPRRLVALVDGATTCPTDGACGGPKRIRGRRPSDTWRRMSLVRPATTLLPTARESRYRTSCSTEASGGDLGPLPLGAPRTATGPEQNLAGRLDPRTPLPRTHRRPRSFEPTLLDH